VETLGLTDEDVRSISARASTLDERLGGPYELPDTAPGTAAGTRLERWCETIARGDRQLFRRRLSWDSWDEDVVLRALEGARLRDGEPLPDWADMLVEVSCCAVHPSSDDGTYLDGANPVPFEEILAPFVVVARERIGTEKSRRSLLSKRAEGQLARALLHHLAIIAAPTLYARFSILRIQSRSPLDRILAAGTGSRAFYEEFASDLLTAGLAPLFRVYPVLARMLAQTALRWCEATRELLDRLAADRGRITTFFGKGADLGIVADVEPGLSDPHHGQRRVVVLSFTSGLKVVYKPKSLGTEVTYAEMLAWLNEHGAPLPFKVLRVLDRGEYGWVEYVEQRPCLDLEQAHRYFTRAGMLLALLHMLDAIDCHRENLVAHGEHPVLIDTETLMHHRVRADMWEGTEDRPAAEELLGGSVLRVGLLPIWIVHGSQSIAYDVSALAGVEGQETPSERPEWRWINTDAMEIAFRPGILQPANNIATLDDKPLLPDAFEEDLQAGFARMYRFLMTCRQDLLRHDGPLHRLASQPVRCIIRHSRVYGGMLQRLHEPEYLRDGADWSVELEQLTRVAMPQSQEARAAGVRPLTWAFFRRERADMTRGDIPLFLACPTSENLEVNCETIVSAFEGSSFEGVVNGLRNMDDNALTREAAFIRAAIHSRTVSATVAATGRNDAAPLTQLLSEEELVREALRLADETRCRALIGRDGGATWVVPQHLIQAGRYQLAPSDHALYGGTSGIALFLAATWAVTGKKEFRDCALAALQPVRRSLREQGSLAGRHMSLGVGDGIASVCYALTHIGRLLDEPALFDDATAFASMLTSARIDADERFDVMSGSAGAILGILPLYGLTGDDRLLQSAIACGRHLVAARQPTGPGMAAWPTVRNRLMTGFAHGAAGCGFALLRLHQVSGDPVFVEAATQAVAYEDSQFQQQEQNWLDLRQDDQPSFMLGWCNGAPGIGLARVGGLGSLDSTSMRGDIEAAVATTIAAGTQAPENLCCGAFGRVEILLTLATRFHKPAWRDEARRVASQVVMQAAGREYKTYTAAPLDLHAPGFFQGTSGVGYTLLRLAYPDRLPGVLLFE
jgi:type 2 lantibiotic biosynthesis protein LanM